jgi:hypothetical protein
MSTFVVEGREQLIAALMCACHDTDTLARENPFKVCLADSNFSLTFKEGLHEKRAQLIARRIRSTPKNTFI